MGDPSGIGPEIVARTFAAEQDLHALVVGDASVLERALLVTGDVLRVNAIDAPDQALHEPGTIDVLSLTELGDDLAWGKVQARYGAASYRYVERGARLALAGAVRALVTAPITKESLHAAGVPYPGHTELLADLAGVERVAMMLANEQLRVVLVSVHVPLREALELLSVEAELATIRLAANGVKAFGIEQPRVAVAGLNPHASENGMFGDEEAQVIAPAVAQAVAEGIDASGPWPPDTVYMHARAGRFDVVVSQYHDQGLIPVKYLGVDEGVNITLGLPFVRTSVDHGTAFDIAGMGKADPSSLQVALRYADRLTAAATVEAGA
jgi:4-hydroxythreonine-4-phosphate dehydrogenase